jgi:hypothetical protein
MDDPFGAGFYVFSNRRWISPDDQQDIAKLGKGIAGLNARFPRFQLEQVALLEALRSTWHKWVDCLLIYNPKKKRRGISAVPSQLSGDLNDKKAAPPNMTIHNADSSACNKTTMFGPAAVIRDTAWESIFDGSIADSEFAIVDPPFQLTYPVGELFDDIMIGC